MPSALHDTHVCVVGQSCVGSSARVARAVVRSSAAGRRIVRIGLAGRGLFLLFAPAAGVLARLDAAHQVFGESHGSQGLNARADANQSRVL